MHQNAFVGGTPPGPAGELTALLRPRSWTGKGREGDKERMEGGRRKGIRCDGMHLQLSCLHPHIMKSWTKDQVDIPVQEKAGSPAYE